MVKFIIAIASALILSSCSVTFYSYSEVNSPDEACAVSRQDAEWARNRKSPTKCIAVYPDSTGRMVYLLETQIKER